jgi:hypothetical protein
LDFGVVRRGRDQDEFLKRWLEPLRRVDLAFKLHRGDGAVIVGIFPLALDADHRSVATAAAPKHIDAVLSLARAAVVLDCGITKRVFEQEAGKAFERLPVFRRWQGYGGEIGHGRGAEFMEGAGL